VRSSSSSSSSSSCYSSRLFDTHVRISGGKFCCAAFAAALTGFTLSPAGTAISVAWVQLQQQHTLFSQQLMGCKLASQSLAPGEALSSPRQQMYR
jgi:hypothetical protein